MSPLVQVIIGELIGTILFIIAIIISKHFDSFVVGSLIVFGTIMVSLLVAWLFIGDKNLYFSTIVLKNILIIIMYEMIIWVCSIFVALIFEPLTSYGLNDREFIILYLVIALVASMLFGGQNFYNAIVKAAL